MHENQVGEGPQKVRARHWFLPACYRTSPALPASWIAGPASLDPGHAGIFLLQRGFDFRIAVRFERGPVESGFQPFALRRAEPKLYRQPPFAYLRVFF